MKKEYITGVFVRAKLGKGWDSIDLATLAQLDGAQCEAFLLSKDSEWLTQLVIALLGQILEIKSGKNHKHKYADYDPLVEEEYCECGDKRIRPATKEEILEAEGS